MNDGFTATVEQNVFAKALELLDKIAERRNTIPILNNILMRAENDRLTMVTTDLDIEATMSIPAAIKTDGATTVHATLLAQVVKKMPAGGQVLMTADGQTMKVTSGKSRSSLHTLPAGDYPVLKQIDTDVKEGHPIARMEFPAGELRRLLASVSFAISTEDTRYYLNGIYVHFVAQDLVIVATDGHRLARASIKSPTVFEVPPAGIIVPKKTVQIIAGLIKTGDKPVIVEYHDTKIRFEHDDVIITSKLIDGIFPDYDRVIPKDNSKTARVDRKALVAAVDRVSTIGGKGKAVRFGFDGQKLDLHVHNADLGDADDELAAIYEHEPLQIGFNANYMLEALSSLVGETVTIKLEDAGSPALIDCGKPMEHSIVVMPMRF